MFLSCRVHPGESSASFCLEGLLEYILDDNDLASKLLNMFVFVIVPMVNPDGVVHGNYRMDTFGHNLNRFYGFATVEKQPSIFALQSILVEYG